MFNRILQVKLVKPRNTTPTVDTQNEILNSDKAKFIAEAAERIVMTCVVAALGFVVLDTGRQVLVAQASKN